MLKRKWQVYLPSAPQEKTLKPCTHTRTHTATLLHKQQHVHVSTQARSLFPHARDVARCNNLIGLLHLSRACVNWGEKLDGFTLYSPLIPFELIPQTNHRGILLSTNPVTPRGALKSNTQPCLQCFLLVNGSENGCMMNSSREAKWWR